MPTTVAAKAAALCCMLLCSLAVVDAARSSTIPAALKAREAQRQAAAKNTAGTAPRQAKRPPSAPPPEPDTATTSVSDEDDESSVSPAIFKAPATRPEGGSVLRLVSGLQGKEDPAQRPLEPIVVPQSYSQTFDPGIAPAGSGKWIDSRNSRQQENQETDYGWFEYLPQGMIPFWGPRTPDSERCSDWGGTLLGSDRFEAWGEPLVGTSWLNRPFGASIYLGVMDGGPLISPYLTQGSGFFGGGRLSWDYDYYWGVETRLGVSYLKLNNSLSAIAPDSTNVFLWDVSMLYYPWGDTRWRPYWIAGLGLTSFRYIDQYYNVSANGAFTIPFGMGVKYQLREFLVARVEVLDNWAMSGRTLDTMHNVSGTFSLEFRFGGHRKSYWPWYPGSYIK